MNLDSPFQTSQQQDADTMVEVVHGAGGGGGARELVIHAVQFYCEPKTLLKNEVYFVSSVFLYFERQSERGCTHS